MFEHNVPGFYAQMMSFAMDAIAHSLKDHVPTNLSFTANSPDDSMADNQGNQDHNSEQPSFLLALRHDLFLLHLHVVFLLR